jgi:hypothetical protein
MSLQVAAALYICIYSYYALKKKSKVRRWRQMQLYTTGKCIAVQVFLTDFNFQAVRMLNKNFARISHRKFKFLMHFIGIKSRKWTVLRKVLSVQESLALTLRFWQLLIHMLACRSFSKFSISSHASCFLILLKCIGCFGYHFIYLFFYKFDTFSQISQFQKMLKYPHKTSDSNHCSRQNHLE